MPDDDPIMEFEEEHLTGADQWHAQVHQTLCPPCCVGTQRDLRQNLFHHPAVDIGESEVSSLEAVCEALMIETQQM